jgi:hypothetical protein
MTQDEKDLIMTFVNQVMSEYFSSLYWCKQEEKVKHLLERSDNSDYATALYEIINRYLYDYDAGDKQPNINKCFEEIQRLNVTHFA